MPALAKGGRARGGEPARVVVTASEVHDPASAGGAVGPPATLGDLRELQRRIAAAGGGDAVTANAFGPGLITETEFFQNNPSQSRAAVALFALAADRVLHVTETADGGGGCLEYK